MASNSASRVINPQGTKTREDSSTRLRWTPAIRESLLYTRIMHTFDLALQPGRRDALNGHRFAPTPSPFRSFVVGATAIPLWPPTSSIQSKTERRNIGQAISRPRSELLEDFLSLPKTSPQIPSSRFPSFMGKPGFEAFVPLT